MVEEQLKQTQKQLIINYWLWIGIGLFIIILGETGIIPNGVIADCKMTEYYIAIVMELLTICIIPVSLRLFRFRLVKKALALWAGMQRWATFRITMLGLPMIINALLYYLFYNVAFGYMGIILFLSMFFITPTKQRCLEEMNAAKGGMGDENNETR